MTEAYAITTKLWIWTTDKAPASWHFLTIDGEAAEAIHALALMRRLESGRRRGWGAMKVTARIGDTEWETSIFPGSEGKEWMLPVKAAVRKSESIVAGDEVIFTLVL